MFEFEWGNPSQILLPQAAGGPDDDASHDAVHHRQIEDHYSDVHSGFAPPPFLPLYDYRHFQTVTDPRAFPGASLPPPPTTAPSLLPSDFDSAGLLMLPKAEPADPVLECNNDTSGGNSVDRIGLNLGLGGRTYFSAADEDFLNRLYRRSSPFDGRLGGLPVVNSPKCQVVGCHTDLGEAKHYHRRHKVCEFHSKASAVVTGRLTQRFCQQCSRFHLLTEFDSGKRSCRRRLADHNRRRRKSHQLAAPQDHRPSQLDKPRKSSCSENAPSNQSIFLDHGLGSPSDSGTHSVSSVTVAVSPPRISIDSLRSMQETRPTCYNSAASSSVSSSSIFY